MKYKSVKQVAWDILRAAMLWYEGADPENYGFNKEISAKGQQLADVLFNVSKKIYPKYSAFIPGSAEVVG